MIRRLSSSLACLAALVVATPDASAQHASEFTARDKTELFIQHVIKVQRLEPAKYQAMVLEYEIAMALEEISDIGVEKLGGDFIHSALLEFHDGYRRAEQLLADEEFEKAHVAIRELLALPDPYLQAHARLLRAELDYRQGRYDEAIATCEQIVTRDRPRLIRDHRACELIALCYRAQEKKLLEFAQLAILVIDYQDVPVDVEKRVKTRLGELGGEVGRPLQLVAGWMNQVEKLLREETTGEDPTQDREKTIVTALDKLIELQEAKERNTCPSCGGSGCKGGCRNGKPRGSRSENPAQVSAIPQGGDGAVNLRGVSRADRGTIWGQLREKDAARALQGYRGKLPVRFEKLLEQYYRELSRDASPTP